ncbi:MAG: uroporphyrinogen decarboxylase, partial [Planctomycetota bacterium]|nr:uroporphyrinogen decarboxylase [Planctomycetota bacterium]
MDVSNPEHRFIAACRGKPVDRTPVWFMRQAGRYLPEYRQIREKHDLLTICKTPDLAVEVTLQPLRRFEFDAAIIFADILPPLEAMGLPLRFAKGEGPVFDKTIEGEADVRNLRPVDPHEGLGFVLEAIRIAREEIADRVPLIGFAGAPFTLASYAIEGGASRNYLKTKSLMWREPETWNLLLTKIADVIRDYLRAQVDAGAQAIQLFDSWVGCLSPRDYERFVLPHSRSILEGLRDKGVPLIHFGTGTGAILDRMKEAGG